MKSAKRTYFSRIMHGQHEHADNLFLRLSSYSPDGERTRLEDFCSEALVWCLRNSTRFRRRFFDMIGASFLQNSDQVVIIHSQQTYRDGEDDARSSAAGRFDIVIEAESSSFFVAVECKIGSPFRKGQIDKYLKRLRATKKQGRYEHCSLVTLTNFRETPSSNVAHLFWGQMHEALSLTYQDTLLESSARDYQEISTILRQFSEFLKLKKLAYMKIPKTDAASLKEFVRGISLRDSMDGILLSLKTTKHLKALLARKQPKLEIYPNDELYLAYSAREKPYFYVGFHVCDGKSSTRLSMYIEISIDGDKRKLETQFQEVMGTTEVSTGFEGGQTWFSFEQVVDERFDGNAEAIREWFNTQTQTALNLAKNGGER